MIAYAQHLLDGTPFGPIAERIAHKHVSLGVRPDQYPIVGKHLVDEFWRSELNRAAELRLRSAKLGLTHEDRLKLRICYVEPVDQVATSAADPAAVTRLDDRADHRAVGNRVASARPAQGGGPVGGDRAACKRSAPTGGILGAGGTVFLVVPTELE